MDELLARVKWACTHISPDERVEVYKLHPSPAEMYDYDEYLHLDEGVFLVTVAHPDVDQVHYVWRNPTTQEIELCWD